MRATDEANQNEDIIYYLGIIDICTPYNTVKKIEHFWKSMTEDRREISCVDPDFYGERFLNFMKSIMRFGPISLRPHGLVPADPAEPPPPVRPTMSEDSQRSAWPNITTEGLVSEPAPLSTLSETPPRPLPFPTDRETASPSGSFGTVHNAGQAQGGHVVPLQSGSPAMTNVPTLGMPQPPVQAPSPVPAPTFATIGHQKAE